MVKAMKIGELLKRARIAAGKTQQQTADHLGISKPSVSEWENDKSRPDLARLENLAAFYGCSITDLLVERGRQGPTLQPILAWEHQDDLPPGEFVLIPRLNVRLSAGNGNDEVEIDLTAKQPQAFRADWVRKKRLKPAGLASMIASGDSMEDRIYDGDAVVVDVSQKEILDGKTYALWYEGGERVKKLFRMPGGGLRIHSNNQKYPDITLPASELEHVRILGRVVHVAGEGGL